ncbi:MAG: hypothetical protein J6O53_06695 [Eubacterium sp.]|nr:hypothetical protein [Eubacterium sp.]
MKERELLKTEYLKAGYIDLPRLAFSLVGLLYFISIIAVNQVKSIIFSAFYYGVLALAAVVFFATKRALTMKPVLLYAAGSFLLAACNVIFVGNMTWIKTGILFMSFLMAAVMLDDMTDERAFLIAVYLNAAVVAVKIAMHGLSAPVYVEASNNYVSVHLLAPAVLYYSLLNIRGKKIPLIPGIVVWVLSLVAGGRGGLLAATILLGGIILHRYLEDEATRRERVLLGCLLVVILIPLLFLLLQVFASRFNGLYVVTRFLDKGLDGGGRLACWAEYIEKSMMSVTRFLFGTELYEVGWVVHYKGNLHNSYLFVHAFLGIFGFLFLMGMLIRAIVVGIRRKMWVYVFSLLAFMFRGLTDHVFGVNRLTVVILALILIPDVLKAKERMSKSRAL